MPPNTKDITQAKHIRWLTKWFIELNECGIDFIPATTIKGHAITGFIAELTHVDKVAS